jgi:hypothetical protein
MKVYLGGPMFTAADAEYNLRLAARLREQGFEVYCPNESEPINDKSKPNILPEVVYDWDIAELESSNVLLMRVSEDSGTNWEAGYFDCLSRHVDSDRNYGIVGLATDMRLRTPPNPAMTGADNQAASINALVSGGLKRSLGVYLDLDKAIERLIEVRNEREGNAR